MATHSTIPAPGDFSFLNDKQSCSMLADAYQAITAAEGWDYMKTDPGDGGYMFSYSDMKSKITSKLTYGGHSGSSYDWTMRMMQRLAQIGWESFVREYQGSL